MNIRPMQPQDGRACARLIAQTPLWQRYGITEASALQQLEDGLASSACIAVAEIDRLLAGFIWYAPRGAFQRSGYVRLVGVRQEAQGKGVGQALMDFAEGEMFRATADIFLLVSDFNQRAQQFYRRRGYQQVGTIPDYVIPGVNELIYHKSRPAEPGR